MKEKIGKRGVRTVSAPAKRARKALAANLLALIDRDYPANKFRTKSARQQKVADDAGMSWSSIQRVLNPNDGKTLDLMTDLAVAFNLKVHEFLDPDLAENITGTQSKLKLVVSDETVPA